MAHADPAHLRRLVGALDELPVFLHFDAKAPRAQLSDLASLPRRVTWVPRVKTSMSSWSLVAAELAGLELALTTTSAQHVAVLTGSDYPLVSMQELAQLMLTWRGYSFIYNRPLPFPKWSTQRHPDGGEWRVRYRVLTWQDNVISWRGVPVHWPLRRDVPEGIELRASSQWKILSRDHAKLLLDIAESRPDLIRFWRSTFIPEESFAASVLSSRALVGSAALPASLATAWHYDFAGWHHPRWLGSPDFDRIAEARRATPLSPLSAFDYDRPLGTYRKLFARKFSSLTDPALVTRIDEELR